MSVNKLHATLADLLSDLFDMYDGKPSAPGFWQAFKISLFAPSTNSGKFIPSFVAVYFTKAKSLCSDVIRINVGFSPDGKS